MFAIITTYYTLKFFNLYLFYFSKMKWFMLIFWKSKIIDDSQD